MEQKHNISYRPDIEIIKRYHTDGTIEVPEQIQLPKPPSKLDELGALEEAIKNLYLTSHSLPEDIKKIANVIIKTIELMYVTIDQESILKPEESEPDFEVNTDTPSTGGNDELEDKNEKDDGFQLSKFQPSYIIKVRESDKIKVINQRYYDAMLQLTEHYIRSYEKATTDYFIELGKLMDFLGHNDLSYVNRDYTVKTTDLKNPELYHLSDFVVRSQTLRDQRYRMFNKVCCERESLNIMKACEASKELLVRYEKESYAENSNQSSKFRNITLYESRSSYEKRIEQNLYNLYKYLNSSVILLGECLKMYVREAEAKAILIKEEGLSL